jgi:acyl-CoA thioesterase II
MLNTTDTRKTGMIMSAVDDLIAILDLERLAPDLYQGHSPQLGWPRIYGGLVIAQALMAAIRSVEGKSIHSLHGYFLLPGNPALPITYQVKRLRDGRSFASRQISALQNGQVIFDMLASFHLREAGLAHQLPMPEVAKPESLPGEAQLKRDFIPKLPENRQKYWNRERPIEFRPVDPAGYFQRVVAPPYQNIWFRATQTLPDDPALHACFLAYASDMSILDSAMVPHGKSIADADLQPASLDHALWFHEDFRVDSWLLYAQDSPWSGHARGLGRGLIYAADGHLIASVAQEGLVRLRR